MSIARRAERRAVNRLRQLRLHDVGPARIDREAGKEQQGGQHACHVDQGKALFAGEIESSVWSWSVAFQHTLRSHVRLQKYAIEYSVCGTVTPNRSSGVIRTCLE